MSLRICDLLGPLATKAGAGVVGGRVGLVLLEGGGGGLLVVVGGGDVVVLILGSASDRKKLASLLS